MLTQAETLLLELTKSKNTPVTPAVEEAARELVAAGLAERREGRGSKGALLRATDAGAEKKKQLQRAQKPTKPAGAARRATAIGAEDLAAFEARLMRRFDDLDRKLAALAQPPGAPEAVLAAPSFDVGQRLLQLTRSLAGRHNPLVAIPELRRALQGVARSAFDAALLELEDRRALLLKIANDPLAVAHPEDGLRIAERGLVYYAALPSS